MQAVQPAIASMQPALSVEDVRRSVAFYVDKLGFSTQGVFEQDGVVVHGEASAGPVQFMFGPAAMLEGAQAAKSAGVPLGAGIRFYTSLDSGIDEYYEEVRSAGVRIVEEIGDRFWGDRTFSIADPDGYVLQFGEHVKDFPADMMANIKPV